MRHAALRCHVTWAEDRATQRCDPSADPGAETDEGGTMPPRPSRRDRHQSVKPSRHDAAIRSAGCPSLVTNALRARFQFTLNQDTRDILRIEFSSQDKERMRELLEKANQGTRTPDEDEEANGFERLGHVLSMLKSIARRTLKHA